MNSLIAECDITAAYDQGYEDGFNAALETLQQCPGDLNLDGTITTTDLLHFLLLFGTVCNNYQFTFGKKIMLSLPPLGG